VLKLQSVCCFDDFYTGSHTAVVLAFIWGLPPYLKAAPAHTKAKGEN